MRKFSKLIGIENNHEINEQSSGEFLFALKRGLLIALMEEGLLTQAQLMQAQNALDKQYKEC